MLKLVEPEYPPIVANTNMANICGNKRERTSEQKEIGFRFGSRGLHILWHLWNIEIINVTQSYIRKSSPPTKLNCFTGNTKSKSCLILYGIQKNNTKNYEHSTPIRYVNICIIVSYVLNNIMIRLNKGINHIESQKCKIFSASCHDSLLCNKSVNTFYKGSTTVKRLFDSQYDLITYCTRCIIKLKDWKLFLTCFFK